MGKGIEWWDGTGLVVHFQRLPQNDVTEVYQFMRRIYFRVHK